MKKTLKIPLAFFSTTLIFTLLIFPKTVIAQLHPMVQIQNQFYAGELEINDAIMQQIQILENPESSNDSEILKCLTPFYIMVEGNSEELTAETLNALEQVLHKSHIGTSLAAETLITESGKFRINYETTGADAVPTADLDNNGVPDYIDEVAIAADSSYALQIITLGYSDPIPDGQLYDIFVEGLSGGLYGFTTTSNSSCGGSPPSGTCLYIDNDFENFYPPNDDPDGEPLGAMRVTVAHEFKHAIQFVENGWQGDPNRWLEMDATLYEEVVYDQVNDYYNYIVNFSTDVFSSPQNALLSNPFCGFSGTPSGCYEEVTWALYFHEQFGANFWPNTWQRIDADASIELLSAVKNELAAMSESYLSAFLESFMWHFASGELLSSANFGFDESAFYPEPFVTETIEEIGNSTPYSNVLNGTSADFYLIDFTNSETGLVKIEFEKSSSEVQIGLIGYFENGGVETSTTLDLDNQGRIEPFWSWDEIDMVGLVVSNSSTSGSENYSFEIIPQNLELIQTTPNPSYSISAESTTSFIRVISPSIQNARVDIFDILGRHVQTVYNGSLNEGLNDFYFSSYNLSTGVYFYSVTTNTERLSQKMTIIR